MPPPTAAAALAVLLLTLQTLLQAQTGLGRLRSGVSLGMGGDAELERMVRRHGNLAENAALLIVGIALAQMLGASATLVWGAAGLAALARISHAVAMRRGVHGAPTGAPTGARLSMRMFGTLGSGLAALLAAAGCLVALAG